MHRWVSLAVVVLATGEAQWTDEEKAVGVRTYPNSRAAGGGHRQLSESIDGCILVHITKDGTQPIKAFFKRQLRDFRVISDPSDRYLPEHELGRNLEVTGINRYSEEVLVRCARFSKAETKIEVLVGGFQGGRDDEGDQWSVLEDSSRAGAAARVA